MFRGVVTAPVQVPKFGTADVSNESPPLAPGGSLGEEVHVEDVEELGADLEPDSFRDVGVLSPGQKFIEVMRIA